MRYVGIVYALIVFLFVSFGIVFAEETPPVRTPSEASSTIALERDTLAKDISSLQELVEEALVLRLEARDFVAKMEQKIDQGIPLTSAELEYVHKGALNYLDLRQRLLVFAYKHKKYIDSSHQTKFSPEEGTRTYLGRDQDLRPVYVHVVDPTDEEGELILQKIKLSLAASLVLYDNYLVAVYPYQNSCKLRRLINFDNTETMNRLQEVTMNYMSQTNRFMVKEAIKLFEQEQIWRQDKGVSIEAQIEYLDLLITGSLSYDEIRKNHLFSTTPKWGLAVGQSLQDKLNFFSKESMNIVSMLFGNTIGIVETRKGKLQHLSKEELEDIKHTLKPLDILLEKTPFRLTDKLIPGFYGHVAVWTGGPEDWEKEGIFIKNDEMVQKYLADINRGHKVVEALRSGVEQNTLKHFMNIDDLVILRHKSLTAEQKKECLLRALAQVGKQYDFNFDVETDKRIVCSELAYVIFHNVNWPTEKSLGRYTISPDNVAHKALRDGPFLIVQLYHDGKLIKKEPQKVFKQLLTSEKQLFKNRDGFKNFNIPVIPFL